MRQFEMNQINNIQAENVYQSLNFIDTGGYNNNTNIVLKKANESDEYYKYINIHNHKEGYAKITVEGNWISNFSVEIYGQHGDALARVQVIVEAQNLHE